jgi:hypothetical protein
MIQTNPALILTLMDKHSLLQFIAHSGDRTWHTAIKLCQSSIFFNISLLAGWFGGWILG